VREYTCTPSNGKVVDSLRTNSLIAEYLYGQPLYPVAPLSWLLPWWSFLCGVAASAAWAGSGGQTLRLLSGCLVAGPLLGTAWAACTRSGWREDPPGDPARDANADAVATLPYTLPGSASAFLSARLSVLRGWWRRVEPRLGRPVVQLAGSTVFALAIAAQLGPQSLVVTLASLAVAYASGLLCPQWAGNPMVTSALPVLGAWLLGHAAYAEIAPLSVLAAAGFSLVFGCLSALDRQRGSVGRNALWLAAPWVVVVASLTGVMQPLAAAVVALLGSLPLLLAPLLESKPGRAQYFRSVQLPLAASMIIAALALGYTP
jgi:hypothetical protein